MAILYPAKMPVIIYLIIALVAMTMYSSPQELTAPLSKPENRELLNDYEMRAKDFVSKNLNRFALDRLQTYNRLLDSLYNSEKKDTLASIENAYKINSAAIRTNIETLNNQIKENSEKKDKLEGRYWALVKKAMIAFVFWLVIILALIQYRKIKLKKAINALQSSTRQLSALDASAKKAEKLFSVFIPLKEPMQELKEGFSKLSNLISEEVTDDNSPADWQEIISRAGQLNNSIGTEDKILNAVFSQSESPKDEKESTDINNLCEQYLEFAIRGTERNDEINIQVTRDFEKRIPALKINPAAVGSLLLNVLTNAFHSVEEKSKSGIKGYQPKVSISTRILPRFLQIRIKDNGSGMSEEVLNKATDEFYSTRQNEEAAGLGLSIAKYIISEMHKGEIKIESEAGNSTDVYIKFFTS